MHKRVMPMSTDILKIVSAADPPRLQQHSPPTSRAAAMHDASLRPEIAADGERLPRTAEQEQASEAAKVEQAVSQVNEFVQNLNRDLQFTVDDDSGRTVIKVLDNETKEVIRQIPPEELLRIANYLLEAEGSSLLLQVQA